MRIQFERIPVLKLVLTDYKSDMNLMCSRISNQITFIGLVSSENYYRGPRIITLNSGRSIGGRVRGELLLRGTVIVRPVET